MKNQRLAIKGLKVGAPVGAVVGVAAVLDAGVVDEGLAPTVVRATSGGDGSRQEAVGNLAEQRRHGFPFQGSCTEFRSFSNSFFALNS
ncbi:hypothetical protein ABZT48_31200 [Streptomyces avermitilis]|uniref:hypothetical protein n=1 Tax=Streptomyces avermitilis TaxID=33903 RepID=UPI00339EA013